MDIQTRQTTGVDVALAGDVDPGETAEEAALDLHRHLAGVLEVACSAAHAVALRGRPSPLRLVASGHGSAGGAAWAWATVEQAPSRGDGAGALLTLTLGRIGAEIVRVAP